MRAGGLTSIRSPGHRSRHPHVVDLLLPRPYSPQSFRRIFQKIHMASDADPFKRDYIAPSESPHRGRRSREAGLQNPACQAKPPPEELEHLRHERQVVQRSIRIERLRISSGCFTSTRSPGRKLVGFMGTSLSSASCSVPEYAIWIPHRLASLGTASINPRPTVHSTSRRLGAKRGLRGPLDAASGVGEKQRCECSRATRHIAEPPANSDDEVYSTGCT
jgi:hypothetical protein